MKTARIIETIILVVLIIICSYYYVKARKESYNNTKALDEQIKKENKEIFTTVKVGGMMCEKCSARITEGLSAFGIVTVDLEAKTATIASENKPDALEIEEAVTSLGFVFEGIE